MLALAAVAVVGGFMQGYTAYQGAKAEAEAMRQSAAAQRLHAFEVFRRAEDNSKVVGREGEKFKGEQVTAYAKSGVMIESGSSLLALEETNSAIVEQQKQIRIAAQYEATTGMKQASLMEQQAKTTLKVGRLGFMSSVIGGAGQAASYVPNSTPKPKG